MKKIGLISLLVIIIDQAIKLLITNVSNIEIIKNFFSITYVRNYGAAFSILNGSRWFLIITAIIAIILVYLFLIKNKNLTTIASFSYGILLGGIIGNLIDRMIFGYVIDYLDFNIFGYNYPIFNFADTCIVIGAFLLVFIAFREDKNANRSN